MKKIKSDTTEVVMAQLTKKFSTLEVEYFAPRSFRIWAHGWHVHHSPAMYGSFAVEASSILKCARNLLRQAKKHPVIRGDNCESGSCPHFTYDD